ncbi:MAG: aminoacyl-tRNA hydrolase [Candidatus Saccharimonadales bacterium]
MSLFAKRPILDSNAPLYSLGLSATVIIVGLGNPGKEYAGTRHNIGFDVIDNFAKKQGFDPWLIKKDMHCMQASHTLGTTRVILCKPTTFMNESGRAVQSMQHFYKIDNSKTLIVYDELDIDFGQIRTRVGGSSAGHNGVKSVTSACGEDYARVRIGIGPKKPAVMDSADFVLAKFSKTQLEDMPALKQEANAIISEYAHGAGQLLAETRSFII